MPRSLQGQSNVAAGRRFRNTAELSGELSAGDVVAAGDVLLAVTGPLTEVRTREHGTNPLPDPGWLPGAGTQAARSRQQPGKPGEPGGRAPACPEEEPGRS
jgi:hypothetical protein